MGEGATECSTETCSLHLQRRLYTVCWEYAPGSMDDLGSVVCSLPLGVSLGGIDGPR